MGGKDRNGLQLFQVFPVYFGEIAENRFIVCSSLKKSVDIFLPVLYEQKYFMLEKKFYVQYLSSFAKISVTVHL